MRFVYIEEKIVCLILFIDMICLNDRDVSVYDHLHRRMVDWQLNVIEMINCKLISIPAVNGRDKEKKTIN